MFETSVTTLKTVSGEQPYVAVLCSTGWKDADQWAQRNLDKKSVTVLWPSMFNRTTCVQPWPLAGAVFLDDLAFQSSDYAVLIECLKPAAYAAGVSPSALVHIAYSENSEVFYSRVYKELTLLGLDSYINPDDGEGIYFRYDTDDNTVKENEERFHEINEDLRSVGYEINDVQIEHDCITGHLSILGAQKSTVKNNEAQNHNRFLYFSESLHLHATHDGSASPIDPFGLPVDVIGEDTLAGIYRFQFVGYSGTYSHVAGVFALPTEANLREMQAYRKAFRELHDHETMTEILRSKIETHLSNIKRSELT